MAGQISPSIPLLRTKLFAPRVQQTLVVRPHLLRQLDDGLHRRLTLVSAPAGFGKSTLLSAWAIGINRPTAWLSLDEGDNDPVRFLAYVVAALQSVAPTVGTRVLDALAASQPTPTDALLTVLLNDLSTVSDQIVLVLDDYHMIDAEPVDRIVGFIIDHLPAQLQLVISSRQDPPLPLARLRARGQLAELRASDLRLSPSESAEFLNQVMELDLSATDVIALEERTEGWIAGLQLAGLSLRGRQDVTEFIRAFAGDHRFIADYLVDEVLQRQPAPVRDFLLQTAILDRLHGPLCDVITGQDDGATRLEHLARGNFFVIPLDDQRRWYRYHHLFADVLRAYLIAEWPDRVTLLHQRASAWYERQGATADAIRHALAADDPARVADMIEQGISELRRGRLGVTLHGWLTALPDDMTRSRPVLSVAYAWALLARGELDGVDARLLDAERWLDITAGGREPSGTASTGMVVANDDEFRRLPATIAVYRAAHAQVLGNLPATITYAQRALDLGSDDDHVQRGAAAALLGLASWATGDLEAAYRHYASGMASLERAGHASDVLSGAVTLAGIRVAQGSLREAERILERAVERATEQGASDMLGTADLLLGLSELRLERDDLEAATQHLVAAVDLATRTGMPYDRCRWCVAMARVRATGGDLDGALDLLDEAERLSVRDYAPDVRPIAAQKARVWVEMGRSDEALGWSRDRGLSVRDEPSYLLEFDHITLARTLLARAGRDGDLRSTREIVALLERLLQAAEHGGRTGSVIEILTLRALAEQARGDVPAAIEALERALALAEPEGYVRVFVEHGRPMASLLEEAAKRGIAPAYARRLLDAFDKTAGRPPARQNLIEPLSDRELDVLRLLGTELTGPEIADELMVTLNTMRTHTKNIYSKLGVNNRRAAVRRAAELDLLSRSH